MDHPRQPAGSKAGWTLLADTTGGSADRSEHLYTAAFCGAGLPAGQYDIAVRGYPFAKDATRYVDSASTWRVKVPAKGAPTCGPVVPNAGPLVAGFGGLME